jgi:NNP family nitrate/nitrite transporter-like MFS transporter
MGEADIPGHFRGFLRAGHLPTLASAFIYFDVSFMVWVLPGALANSISLELGLGVAAKGLLVATPLLGGAFMRVVMGIFTDRWGARRTGLVGLTLTVPPLLLAWLWADSFSRLILVGLLLSFAGASFAVAIPLATSWYPARYQGFAAGVAGAGNSGTALAMFFAPRLAESFGWHSVFGLALVPVLLALCVFGLLAEENPERQPAPTLAAHLRMLRQTDAGWLCLFYAVTFGGFVGLASFLSIFFHDQYALSSVQAGSFATICVVAGSFLRPIGGYGADRLGGVRLLTVLYFSLFLVMLGVASLPPLPGATLLLFTAMGLLGMGNGAVFQLVPLRFPRQIGMISGLVGAAGGVGGFFLPNILGTVKQATGSFAGAFLLFALTGLGCTFVVTRVGRGWHGQVAGSGGRATSELPARSGNVLAPVEVS